MIGTYLYMAPERIDADSYSLNSDIWSLGIIVMECILGYYPYIIYNNNTLPNSVWMVHELIENNQIKKEIVVNIRRGENNHIRQILPLKHREIDLFNISKYIYLLLFKINKQKFKM